MKKYLITGALALVACATLTSCHSDDELSGSYVQQKLQAYDQMFEDEFGKVSPNQDWGFGTTIATRTRAENANANEWGDPTKDYGGLLVPPPLTEDQLAVVIEYFQTVKDIKYKDPHWSNYFIQQVYKGYTSPLTGTNPAYNEPYSPEKYLSAAGGNNYIIASDHMDHLIAIDPDMEDPETGEKPFVDHINNFNHGDCSNNDDVLYYGGSANTGPFHSDKIMYMKNSTTKSFAYHNSEGSLYHTEYTGLVSFETIIEHFGEAKAGCLRDGWNRSFMGFDFEQIVGKDVYAKNIDYNTYVAPENQQKDVEYVDGHPVISYKTWTFDGEGGDGKEYYFLTAETNMYAADRTEDSYVQKNGSTSNDPGKANFNNRPSNAIIADLLSKGYLPYSDTLKDWVKVGGTADGYFSDWIVTLTEANPYNTITIPIEPGTTSSFTQRTYKQLRYRTDYVQSGRIMCEDLGTSSISDIDFNDIVFDAWMYHIVPEVRTKVVKIEGNDETILEDWSEWIDNDPDYAGQDYYTTDVYLLAGGGTIPATVAGIPFKNALSSENPILVNTVDDRDRTNIKRYGNPYDNTIGWHQPADLKDMRNIESLNDIEVIVLYNNSPIPLKSEPGKVPHKICVPIGTKWPYERIVINEAYDFNDYVKNGSSVSYVGTTPLQPILNSNDEVIGYYQDERDREDGDGNNIWTKDPTEDQTDSRFHGDVTDEGDITGIPYRNVARVVEGSGRYTVEIDLGYKDVTVSGDTSGYHEGEPVLVRRRH